MGRLSKTILILIITLTGVFLIYSSADAALVPCGRTGQPPCTTCDLFVLADNVIKFFVFTFTPALAVLLYLIAGFLVLLGGANPSWVSKGRDIFKTTTYSLFIIFGAWLITNTLLKTLAGEKPYGRDWNKVVCTEPTFTGGGGPPDATLESDYIFDITKFVDISEGPAELWYVQIRAIKKSDGSGAERLPIKLEITDDMDRATIFGPPVRPTSLLANGEAGLVVFIVERKVQWGTYDNGTMIITEDSLSKPTKFKFSHGDSGQVFGNFELPGGDRFRGSGAGIASLTIFTPSLPNAQINTPYSYALQAKNGKFPYFWSLVDNGGLLPDGSSLSSDGKITGRPTREGNFTFTVKVDGSSPPSTSGNTATKQLSIKVTTAVTGGAICPFSGVNLCQGDTTAGCANASCDQYADAIARQANGAATANVLKAMIFAESSCNASVTSWDSSSFGLMQLQPSTANMFKNRCGISTNITSAWLTNPQNVEANICIGAAFINSIAAGICGNQIRNIYAGYNGGPYAAGACAESTACGGETSCDGSAVKKWECLYDDTNHRVCNGDNDIRLGYNQTRAGARKVVYCAANPGF